MIADLIEANLRDHPERAALLRGKTRRVRITAADLETDLGVTIGDGMAVVTADVERPHLWIYADSDTLIDLPNAGLMMGLPSLTDPIGRAVTQKLLSGRMRIRGMYRIGLVGRVQKLLSVSGT
jgi:hypothetical protein